MPTNDFDDPILFGLGVLMISAGAIALALDFIVPTPGGTLPEGLFMLIGLVLAYSNRRALVTDE